MSSYEPSDFSPTDRLKVKGYLSVFGKREWESIAEKIIKDSQREGKWTVLAHNEIDTLNSSASETDIYDMLDAGYLMQKLDGYMLTEDALEKLVAKYPSETFNSKEQDPWAHPSWNDPDYWQKQSV